MDWNSIKTEYITTKTSYRRLSEKYGLSAAAIAKRAGAENWGELRREWLVSKARTDTRPSPLGERETVIAAPAAESGIPEKEHSRGYTSAGETEEEYVFKARKMQKVAGKLLDKIELAIDNIDSQQSNRAVKEVTDALKTVKNIMEICSPAEVEEHEAKMARLRRESDERSGTPELVVSFRDEELERWGD